MEDKNWYLCPHCGKRILKTAEGAKSKNVFIKCKGCGKEIEIRIGDVSHEPENK